MYFYRNGNYTVCITDDGTKTRRCDHRKLQPSYPECVDVSITQKCGLGCKFCFANCTPDGVHADIMSYKFLDTLQYYTEVAFNGNDLDHPQLIEFLQKLKERKVFANMTVNQAQFMVNLGKIMELVDKKLIYGVGVSYSHYNDEFIREFKKFDNGVLHVINGIVNTTDLFRLQGLGLKLLILGYKDIGRGAWFMDENKDMIEVYQKNLCVELPKIISSNMFKAVSFDNLAIRQLNVRNLMSEDDWEEFYMGDDGDFTFYIDLVNGTFSKNSCETKRKYTIGDKTIDAMFETIKEEKYGKQIRTDSV